MPDNLSRLRDLLSEQLGADRQKVEKDSHLKNDLGADSLDCVEIVMAIEEEWGVDITDDESDKFKTVQDILNYLETEAQ